MNLLVDIVLQAIAYRMPSSPPLLPGYDMHVAGQFSLSVTLAPTASIFYKFVCFVFIFASSFGSTFIVWRFDLAMVLYEIIKLREQPWDPVLYWMEVKTAVYTLKLLSLSISESQLRWDVARLLSEMLKDTR